MTKSDNDLCKLCGDKRGNHEGRIHAFAEMEGQLETPQQQSKREQMTGLAPRQTIPLSALGAQADLGRLVEVLLTRGLITQEEALYAFGVGSKPSGYQDPAVV